MEGFYLLIQDMEEKDKRRKRGDMPRIPVKKEEDVDAMKQRIANRVAAASSNRQKEMDKIAQKLARQEAHARQVQERKRLLAGDDDMRLSVGGENEGLEAMINRKEQESLEALAGASTRSTNGVSSVAESDSNMDGARYGSGRSMLSDTTASESRSSSSNVKTYKNTDMSTKKAPLGPIGSKPRYAK